MPRSRGVVRKPMLTFILLVALAVPIAGQSNPSMQGVWRNIERVVPATTNPGDRVDPFGHVPVGTQKRWGPFAANAGRYELSGDTLTLHGFVSKEPRNQRGRPDRPA
jgi:hypothetical protein